MREDGVLHLVRGAFLTGNQPTPGTFVTCRDTLTCGPCSADPATHRAMRIAYWSRDERNAKRPVDSTADVLGASDLTERLDAGEWDRIHVWTSPSWDDVLFSWWVMDSLARMRSGTTARIDLAGASRAAEDPLLTLEEMRRFLAIATPLGRAELDAGANLWQAFASDSPSVFLNAVRASRMESACEVADCYVRFFPRVRDSRLDLSEFDFTLLKSIGVHGFKRPLEIIDAIKNEMGYLPMEFVRERLAEWAEPEARRPPALDCRRGLKPALPWTSVAYQLSAHGERLLDDGMASPSDAPPMHLGGYSIYEGDVVYDLRRLQLRRLVP